MKNRRMKKFRNPQLLPTKNSRMTKFQILSMKRLKSRKPFQIRDSKQTVRLQVLKIPNQLHLKWIKLTEILNFNLKPCNIQANGKIKIELNSELRKMRIVKQRKRVLSFSLRNTPARSSLSRMETNWKQKNRLGDRQWLKLFWSQKSKNRRGNTGNQKR